MKIKEHHGIKYQILKAWHPISNDYELLREYSIQTNILGYDIDTEFMRLTPTGMLTARIGFPWNGPSGPTVDTETFMRGSLIHDLLYRLLRLLLLPWWVRDYADALLYRVCLEDGMWKLRAVYVRKAVHEGGIDSALPGGS